MIGIIIYINIMQRSKEITLVFALLLGYVSAYFPARKISKMDPVESLRYE
ncbi:puttaive FtsX-family transport protein [Streptococcus pneumoniae]|nr:puttaive FtsX-family transport protein [Streptococcus pneumoniae]